MRVLFVYPRFERHAQSHPVLRQYVPCDEYLGGPSLGIANLASVTPPEFEVAYIDDRVTPLTLDAEADLYAFSFFTPAATRALALGDMLRAAGRKTVAGGIFPSTLPEVAKEHFDSIVVGEAEGVWPQVLADFRCGKLQPRYQQSEPFDLKRLPPPRIDLYVQAESPSLRPDDYPLQISRGCPLSCDACAVPGVMGSRLRLIPRETLRAALQDLARLGKRAAVTEDTSFFFFSGARRHLRGLFELLRDDPRPAPEKVSYIGISMPLLLSLDPTLLEQAAECGVGRFYLVCGFDPITRAAFGSGDTAALAQAQQCITRCHDAGIEPYTSLLVGNETDDEGVFDRILDFADRARIQKAEFAIFTPYPGTPAWQRLHEQGRIFDAVWQRYNDANVVFYPKQMSPERLLEGYLTLWREFYRARQQLGDYDHAYKTIQF